MRIRNLVLTALCASIGLGAAAPAFADDDWHRHDRQELREHEWRQHDRREHEWREHEWREHESRERQGQEYYAPPVVVAPAYGTYAPPPVYYANPSYYR
jgi:hypothetical protein